MTLSKAIEAAKIAGWKADDPEFGSYLYDEICILSDRHFWMCLSNYKRWNAPIWKCDNYNSKADEPGEKGCGSLHCEYAGWRDWKKLWHEAIDIAIDGGDLEEFFNSFL